MVCRDHLEGGGPRLGDNGVGMGVFVVAVLGNDGLEAGDSGVYVGVGVVEGGDAEADVVGVTEVGDDVHFLDVGLVDAPAVGVAEGDVGASLGGIGGGFEVEACGGREGLARG